MRAEGLAEGEAKGKIVGQATALLRILERRFQHVPKEIQTQIQEADLVTLERWFECALDAQTLADIFFSV